MEPSWGFTHVRPSTLPTELAPPLPLLDPVCTDRKVLSGLELDRKLFGLLLFQFCP